VTAEIIYLPVTKRECGSCINAYLGVNGVYCAAFSEFIDDEYVANDCEEYDQ